MPQLSLYIDQDTLKKIELAAKKEKVSISQWVKVKLQNSFEKKWPEHFFQLYGSIVDDSFDKPAPLHFKNESPRDSF
ncbi:toxin-antitoxin system, antitoxin component [Leptospira kemamanensis]|uniref:Toxin-antitoxin system, antitoxin component n=1 Tax=Leptospira kemamanensis TaxID=2484942 RepID=A0A4R9JXZ0_9LEPT|nr:toxin-antitoxin system, antitoxin component [Leptospira kemamanensis]TGL57045.1 toxin-antitoxin system, antitoxin component [Leptospira kemamanensis]